MATPEQLIQAAKAKIATPNMQGTRGGPARGGIAVRPPVGGAAMLRRPDPAASGPPPPGAGIDQLTRNPGFPGFRPAGGMPLEATGAPGGGMPPGKPAWQQLQEMGVGGQGSAQANKAMLAQKLGGMPPGGPGGDPGMMPGGGGAGPGDDPTMRTFPGFKPRGEMMPGGPSPSGPIAMPMPGQAPAPPPGALDPNSVMDTAPPGGGGFESLGRIGAGLGRRPRLAGAPAY